MAQIPTPTTQPPHSKIDVTPPPGMASSRDWSSVNASSEQADRRAGRLHALPPFLFNEITKLKLAAKAAGVDVIDLGVGDPDRPTHDFIVQEMARAIQQPENHRYPDFHGTPRFKQACAHFMRKRFGVEVDPARHILALMGAKDGIAHLPFAVMNPGDAAVVFVPAYPVYENATILAGGRVHRVELNETNNWRPDWNALDQHITNDTGSIDRTRVAWINYPNNPTGASANLAQLSSAVQWCAQRDVILASDLAYSELYYGNQNSSDSNETDTRPNSIYQSPGIDIDTTLAIEFHSLSKSFNMTGWRLGFAVGHPRVIAALTQMKDNTDSGPFNAVQQAGALAIERFDDPAIAEQRAIYKHRRDLIVDGLRGIGAQVTPPDSGFFVWARTPNNEDAMTFCARSLEKTGVVLIPGSGFSPSAKHWFRVALSVPTERIAEAMGRLQRG